MQDWIKVTLILCLFGTLREIRPSEPFVSEFLLGEWRNITEEQLNRDVYPVGTYSYLAQLVVIFLITDFLRFKPVIILSGLSGIAVYAILLWTESLEWLQVCQFFYGTYMATEVDAAKYPRVTSYTRIAALMGRFLSGVTAQLLTHLGLMDYRQLNYITFTAQILATFWALWLPPVQYGIYFHRRASVINTPSLDKHQPGEKRSFGVEVREAYSLIVRHARAAYTRPKVLAWSALYAAALALFVQAQIYVQLLWREIQTASDAPIAYNGAVEALQTLLGALGAFLSSIFSRFFLPAPVAAIQGAAVFVGTYVTNIFVSYAGYIVMGTMFHYTITLASAKIASQLSDDSCFGLIFGINTLVGTGLQSILTLVLIQSLMLPVASQYYALSGLFTFLATIWIVGCIMHVYRQKQSINI
ncbi:reduced folate transporter-like isoform X2 [Pectinophora gossypiella]|uniref:reduced folate transporter-like isoform X2 n=1 Tax=Pectinophora gossypiella TaxID=13191 RepID=UPI00214E0C40|nr:reduced folate transporter-like isoform X2 [Pectinophora gossypiella]